MGLQPTLRDLANAKSEKTAASEKASPVSVVIEEEQAFGFDVTQENQSLQGFCYHHLVTVELSPGGDGKADKMLVTTWAHEGEITGFRLLKLARAMSRGRGVSIAVKQEKDSEKFDHDEPFVFSALFKKRKAEPENPEADGQPGPETPPDLPGAIDVDPNTFRPGAKSAETKGQKKDANP
jgi:hypothetical protein